MTLAEEMFPKSDADRAQEVMQHLLGKRDDILKRIESAEAKVAELDMLIDEQAKVVESVKRSATAVPHVNKYGEVVG